MIGNQMSSGEFIEPMDMDSPYEENQCLSGSRSRFRLYRLGEPGDVGAASCGAGACSGSRPGVQIEEYLLLGNATRGAGEPMIAVDPTNPKNIIAVAMGSIQQLHGKPATQGSTNQYHLVAGSTINWLGVTHDGGVTWEVKEQPILSGKFKRCPDAFANVTEDGVFIAGCEPRETDSISGLLRHVGFSGIDRQRQDLGTRCADDQRLPPGSFRTAFEANLRGLPNGSP